MNTNDAGIGAGSGLNDEAVPRPHPRTIGWLGTTALAMGGSNQSLFLLGGATGLIATQGSGAVPLLALGLLLSWMALPGWLELVMMWPNRVGGIAATCSEAFRPISPVLANLTGICYWWGWVPPCGLCAWLAAKAITTFYLPMVSDKLLAVAIVILFTWVNLRGIRVAVRFAVAIATVAAGLALVSGLTPILSGRTNWIQATSYHLLTPFPGGFGVWTSAMSGLYLIGFAAPAFEQAVAHVGETIDPERNVPRAMFASAIMATLFFVVLPVVWLGVLGVGPVTGLSGELWDVLGPTFAPVLGHFALAAAIWFMVFNMLHGTLTPLAGPARTLLQLSEDGLLPRVFARRNDNDAPWVATCFTAFLAIVFLLVDDPLWLIAAANFCYLIGICLPSIAVCLLRRSAPEMRRPFRATSWAINMGVIAAVVWGISTVFGFRQYGLPSIIIGVAMAYAGSILYAWRRWEDRRITKEIGVTRSLHFKLTGAMIVVLSLDAVGYLLALSQINAEQTILIAALEDIFVLVALLTIGVGLVLPGIITHAAEELSHAAQELAHGTMKDLSRAMQALAAGDLESAHARVDIKPIKIHSQDELGVMAESFNALQREITHAVLGLNGAREGLGEARAALTLTNVELQQQVLENTVALLAAREAEGKTRESEERFRQVTEHVREVFWMTDVKENRVIYISPAFEVVWGRPCGELYNSVEAWLKEILPEDQQRMKEAGVTLMSGLEYSVEYRITRPDATVRWIHDRSFAVRNDDGEVYRMVGIAEDITERHEAQQTVLSARVEADRANAAKSEFLSRMSHELRTPLNAILGFGQIIERRSRDADTGQQENVGQILKAGRHLLNLINEVLDIVGVEAGRSELSLESISLSDIVPEACGLVQPLAAERTIDIAFHENIGEGNVIRVLADRQRLKQVLINLLANAIKYNREGGSVNVSCAQSSDGTASIAVCDTGLGIAPDDLKKLFTPFERLSFSSSTVEGTGLGLVLSQRLVMAMGGVLHVESTTGQGSTFTIELPLATSALTQAAAEPAKAGDVESFDEAGRGHSVLCIEDNLSNLRLIEAIFEGRPEITLLSAMQGSVGLDLARHHHPDVILLDLNLPDISGKEVLDRLKESIFTRDIPVIIVSADATPVQIDCLLEAGAVAYLTKPLDVHEFECLLEKTLRTDETPLATLPASA